MRLAGIDFGTNSVRLLVCDCIKKNNRIFLNPINRQNKITRLGKNLHNTKLISNENISETKKALDEFKKILSGLKPERTCGVATSVFRDSKNGEHVRKDFESYCGFPIQAVSGKKEAELMFRGMFTNRNQLISKTVGCIDIGGGSCEIIFAENNNIVFNKSYDIGCLRSKYMFFNNNPPTGDEIKSLRNHIRSTVSSDLKKFRPECLICFGGTITSLSAIFNNKLPVNIESLENFGIRKNNIDSFLKKTKNMTEQNIAEKYSGYLDIGRESVIFSGTVIIEYILKILKKDTFTVTNQGILFGLISEIFENSLKNK